MTRIIAGFFNTEISEITSCDCGCGGAYAMPFIEGDTFDIFLQDEAGTFVDLEGFSLPAGLSFTGSFVAITGGIRKYTLTFTGTAQNSGTGFSVISSIERPVSALCGTLVGSLCGETVEDICTQFLSGTTCYYVASCYESVVTWVQKINNVNYTLTQRLPIRVYNPQPKIDGIKTYQKTNGAVMRIGRARMSYEYTLETDYMPDLFHRQLLQMLMTSENISINGKNFNFGGDYQIQYAKNSKIMRATCKMVENQGLYNC